MVFLYIVLGYFLIVWVLVPLVVPYFLKESLPTIIPESFRMLIERLSAESTDNLDFLKKSYQFITTTYRGSRIKTITHFWTAFEEPINHRPGFMPCTGQNYLLRLMLVKSGRFPDPDIRLRITPLNLFIHQYLQVKINGKWIDIDPWSSFLNVPFGKKSSLLG